MLKRLGMTMGLALFGVMLFAGSALAQIQTPAVDAVEGGAASLRDTLVEIVTTVLPYGLTILAIFMGWRFARRFFTAR